MGEGHGYPPGWGRCLMEQMSILIVEDGTEYIDRARRWMGEGFEFTRAGSGPAALEALGDCSYPLVWMDMDFRRCPENQLLGWERADLDRFSGDRDRMRQHLWEHQGVYILEAIRAADWNGPVVFSHDFSDAPKRWTHLCQRYGPLDWLPEAANPAEIRQRFHQWVR